MKVLGIVGSYRKDGNTDILVKKALEGVASEGIDVEYIFLGDKKIYDCIGCEGCKHTYECVIKDDMYQIYKKLIDSDAIILGSPTYFYNITGIIKNFIDRLYCFELFDKDDRSVWMGINDVIGIKYASTIAVCEQKSEEYMGFTSLAMSKSLEAIGYRIIDNLKVLHAFSKGEINNCEKQMKEAYDSGIKLSKTIKLRQSTKDRLDKLEIFR
ncbi:flavodoxin family protein [Clostridium sp.]|uniref:flavodoxin family protein n=1 Tax=Clostridium sp. TaxID=1506 RepID=UPI003F2A61DB